MLRIVARAACIAILVIAGFPLAPADHAEAKHSMNLLTREEVERARARIAARDPAAIQYLNHVLGRAERWLKYPDEHLRDMVPTADIPRAFNVHFKEDPRNPEAIRRFGHYPWIIDPDLPYKVISPVDGFVYPTNDFDPKNPGGPEDVSEEPYVDTGWGWKDPNDDQKYWFVAYYTHWLWKDYLIPATLALAEAYLLTERLEYAHKAAVLLDRIAEVFPDMDYVRQSRYGTEIQPGNYHGRILNHHWGVDAAIEMATAYDYIYEAMPQLTGLPAATGKSVDEVRLNIEQNLLEDSARSIYTMDGRIAAGNNIFATHRALATIAIVLDNENTPKYLDWILNNTGAGGGRYEGILIGLTNMIYRDGAPNRSAPGYNVMWINDFHALAELLLRYGVDLYANEPKLKHFFDYPLRLMMNEKFVPNIGDSGSVKASGPVGWVPDVYATAFRRYRDANYARVVRTGGSTGLNLGSIYDEPVLQEADALLRREGFNWSYRSDNLPAYGLALLRTGRDGKGTGLALYYGASGDHGHYDRLNIELFAHGNRLMPDLGYPEYMTAHHKKLYGWTGHTLSHNTVLVDEQRQLTKKGGRLEAFAAAAGIQYVDVRAEEAYPGIVERYQRSVALIDVSPSDAYVVDIFRVTGGRQHDYSLHGPDGAFHVLSGLSLSEAETRGSLAGVDIPFGTLYDAPELERPGYSGPYTSYAGSGFGYLRNVQRGNPSEVWSAEWVTAEFPRVRLRATFLPQANTEVIVADGEPPQHVSTNPVSLKYVLHRRVAGEGERLESAFVSILEPYRRAPLIRGVQRLGPENTRLIALRIDKDEGTDFVLQSYRPDLLERVPMAAGPDDPVGDITFQGHFGLISRGADGALQQAYLLGGGELVEGDFAIRAAGSYAGSVIGFDPETRRVRVQLHPDSPPLAEGAALAGERIVIYNERHSTEYLVVDVAASGLNEYVLTLGETGFLTGKGKAQFSRSRSGRTYMGSLTPLPLGTYYEGQWMVDPASGAGARIEVFAPTIELSGVLNFQRGQEFLIFDFGPGDHFRILSSVQVTREPSGDYRVVANVPATIVIGDERISVDSLSGAGMHEAHPVE